MQGVPTLFPEPREEQSLGRVSEPAGDKTSENPLMGPTHHFSALTCFSEHFAKQKQKGGGTWGMSACSPRQPG